MIMFFRPVDNLLDDLRTKDFIYWNKKGQTQALALFHRAATEVPAYKDFLAKNGLKDHDQVETFADFVGRVPLLDKENYIDAYDLPSRLWPSKRLTGGVVYASSGSTGQPTFWVRNNDGNQDSVLFHEVILKEFFAVDKYKTLFVVCFAMGIHVAGYITARSIEACAKEYPNVFLATPGSKKEDIKSLLLQQANNFEQIVLIGYPPFIKDTVTELKNEGFAWDKLKNGFIFSAQGFSEDWRRHLQELVGAAKVPIINIYGCADAGALGFETDSSIALRQVLQDKPESRQELLIFGDDVPYIFQYYPDLRYFESIDNELVFTSDNGVPLIRYNLHDRGGIIEPTQLKETPDWQLPLVYVYGRSNYSVVFYGANVYPENFQTILSQPAFAALASGKFFLELKENERYQQVLDVHVELSKSVDNKEKSELEQEVKQTIIEQLAKVNRELHNSLIELGNQDKFFIRVYNKGDGIFANPNMKHKYIK